MNGINLNRVLVGGIAAGVLILVGEFALWALLLEPSYEALMARYGLAETNWAMTAYVMGCLALGLVLAFGYAAMRPRFGAGWRTGIAAAGIVWVAGVAVPMISNGAIGLSMGAGATALALAWTAVEVSLAGVLAGWVYQEREAVAPAMAAGANASAARESPGR